MNLQKIANSNIRIVNPNKPITVYKWKGQKNIDGTIKPEYEDPVYLIAQVQPTSDSRLERIDGVNTSKVNKTFWIPSDEFSGLDPFEKRDRDIIVMDGHKYRIVHQYDQFETGWIVVVCEKGELYNEST